MKAGDDRGCPKVTSEVKVRAMEAVPYPANGMRDFRALVATVSG